MGALLRRIARTCILLMAAVILALGLAGSWCAFAQSPKAAPAAEKPAASSTPAAENLTRAAEAANPAINTKDIVNRLNQELGIDLLQPDATQLKLDWLRDMIAESAARPAERHAGNGSR